MNSGFVRYCLYGNIPGRQIPPMQYYRRSRFFTRISKMHATESTDKPLKPRSRGFARSGEAAEFLGITRQHLAKMIREGKVPAQRYGNAVRIPWQWLIEQENCDKPAA
jgi:excisionase family DNA binding protein